LAAKVRLAAICHHFQPITMTTPTFTGAAQTWKARFLAGTYLFGTEPNHYLRRQARHWKSEDREKLAEGTQHYGRSALIGSVARKPHLASRPLPLTSL
jgi:hypothetical protein